MSKDLVENMSVVLDQLSGRRRSLLPGEDAGMMLSEFIWKPSNVSINQCPGFMRGIHQTIHLGLNRAFPADASADSLYARPPTVSSFSYPPVWNAPFCSGVPNIIEGGFMKAHCSGCTVHLPGPSTLQLYDF